MSRTRAVHGLYLYDYAKALPPETVARVESTKSVESSRAPITVGDPSIASKR